jgi:hypothetical protein
MLVRDARVHAELADAHRAFVAGRRAVVKDLLAKGVARGELRASTDLDVACDLVVGPAFYRFLVSGEPITDGFLDAVVDAVVRAFAR